jgi:3-oxoacyl-[acyl-carrier-protein] synthase-3
MGTVIEGIGLSTGGFRSRHSALRLAVAAARAALERTDRLPSEVDLLVNVGIYRDRNLGEPALAALIQEDLGANPEDPHAGGTGTFSFDVANGTCGALTALQLVDGFLEAGTVRAGLVVASDADPGRNMAADFPFSPAGGAAVCAWTEGDRGLGPWWWHHMIEDSPSFRSTVRFEGGSNVLTIAEDPEYPRRAGEAAARAVEGLLERSRLSVEDFDAVIAHPGIPDFTATLIARTGISRSRLVSGPEETHTSGLLAALARAESEGRLGEGSTVLLVSAGPGVVAGAAVYRV